MRQDSNKQGRQEARETACKAFTYQTKTIKQGSVEPVQGTKSNLPCIENRRHCLKSSISSTKRDLEVRRKMQQLSHEKWQSAMTWEYRIWDLKDSYVPQRENVLPSKRPEHQSSRTFSFPRLHRYYIQNCRFLIPRQDLWASYQKCTRNDNVGYVHHLLHIPNPR